jgi:acetyl esterase/lipase
MNFAAGEQLVARTGGPPVRVRVYPGTPAGPLLVWAHGGAFIGGSLDMPESDAVCQALAPEASPV